MDIIVVYGIESCYIAIENSSFISNSVNDDGGVVYVQTSCFILLTRCGFDLNTARDNGGVIYIMEGSTISIFDSDISLGEAGDNGGVIYGETNCTISIDVSVFSNNTANRHGGVTYIEDGSIISINNSAFSHNRAAHMGGVISALLRNTINVSNTSFSCNVAGEKGGAMAVDNSFVTVYGKHTPRFTPQSMIENNSAAEGGGVYLLNSQFYFKGDTIVADNQATERGGGVHAMNSSIIVERDVHFVNNTAEYGGGISIERNGKLYGLSASDNNSTTPLLTFTANRAKYGGALHVADETNPVLCSSSTNSECFVQPFLNSDARLMLFSDNSAEISGSNLFGGLLDRCTIRDLTSGGANFTNGATSFKKLSGITELETIASDPVRICYCKNEEPDCSYDPSFIKVKRGESIDISIVAVDHVNHTINDSTIYASLNSTVGSVGEGQETQRTHTGCTDLSYDLLSPHDSEQLLLHAEGPCSNRGISQLSTLIQILPCTCPIGFVRSKRDKARCLCDCDPKLSGYITECDPSEGSVLRKGNFWIMYVNSTISGGYLIYPNCPLGYCHPPNEAVVINLNVPNGADVQCVSNRSGLLCGTCQPGFSLSIGSSHCIKCLNNWPVVLAMILVSSIIAGIALVILILVLNLTVAVGTLNAIIFYANIVGANSSAFFLSSEITFASVFISWLNLDIGIDSCFFKGMDAYSKTWLQLAFPAYIIFIITMVIFFSSCSSKFANLIGKRNPVATLSTLLLLSYSKLLQTIISAFSFATLVNPSDLTSVRVWLPDASEFYLNGKHIPLFVVAIIIFLIGLAYTFLLFTWQLFLRSPRARIFNWTRSLKLSFFMDTYHSPYTPRHRYWTGLLLIARAILFLVSAINFSGDPRVTLLSTIVIVSLFFFYKALFNVRIYKNWLISAMETLVYLNIVIFATFTWYTFDTNRNQSAVAHTSVGIVFIMLVFVIAYHVYRYLNIQPFSKLRQSVFCKKLSKKLHPSTEKNQGALEDKNTQELFDAIDRDPQDEATHTFLDILESQNRGHQETSSSIPDLDSGTEVTISKSKGSTEVSMFNPNIETKNLLTPLLDNGESTV